MDATRFRPHVTRASAPGASRAPRRRLRIAIITAAWLLAAILALPGSGMAASYDYRVIDVEYDVTASVAAGRSNDVCVAGLTSAWIGVVVASPGLAALGDYGDGSLQIRRTGTFGNVNATLNVDNDFAGTHGLWTECGDDASSTESNCTDYASSNVNASAVITGGTGTKVKLIWDFQQAETEGYWVPDTFECVEPMAFEHGACRSRKGLSTFTERKFSLPFRCFVQKSTPPADSGYYRYLGSSTAVGKLTLKRVRQG